MCCPFIVELKNMLTEFNAGESGNNNSGGTFRKITPLSASHINSRSNTLKKDLQVSLIFFAILQNYLYSIFVLTLLHFHLDCIKILFKA